MDIAILKFINLTIANPAFDLIFRYVGDFDLWRWPLGLALILLLWRGGARGRWCALAAAVAVAITDPSLHYIFKPLVGRLRPCQDPALTWVRAIDGCGGRFGFPSNHAGNVMALAVVIGWFYRWTRYFLYPLAAVIAISRVYLGVHYPADILAGAAYGAVVGLAVLAVIKALARHGHDPYLPARS